MPLGEVFYPDTVIKLVQARSRLHHFQLTSLPRGKNAPVSP